MIIPLEWMLSSVPHMAKASSTMAETPPPSNTRTNGNFLVEFAQPSEPFDAIRRDLPLGIGKPPLLAGKQLQSVVDKYRTMERKGFRVTKDIGCLIPDEQYDTYQPGSTFKGHQRTFAFFARWVPKHGTSATRNEFGWPTDLQISHLCHRRSCCRVDHLVAEEQWRNLKRTYCGLPGDCDCGQPVKCLRRYQMQDQAETPEFCGTKEEAVNALTGAPPFVIHGSSRCSGGDNKSHLRKVNNEKRKRKQAAHAHKTARKQARLQTQSDEDA